MRIQDFDGNAVFEGTWTAVTAAKSFDSTLLAVPKDATHWVRYTTGATAALVPGETLTGGTSSATCTLVAQAVEVGTAGSGDVGIIFVKDPSGAFQAETLTGAATGTVDIIQDLIEIPRYARGNCPKAALISVESADANVTLSGTTPTVSTGTNHGTALIAGQNWLIRGVNNIQKFKAINAIGSNGAILKYVLYF